MAGWRRILKTIRLLMKRLLSSALLLCLASGGLSTGAGAVTQAAAKPAPKSAAAAPVKPKPAAPASTWHPAPAPVAPPPPPVPVPTPVGPKTWALLVGVSKYESPQIASLRFPSKDAAGLRDALVDPTLGGLGANQALLLSDEGATREAIMGAVGGFLKPNVKPGDKVIVFLAGHGIAKGVGLDAKSYLLPTDVKGLTTAALENSAVNLRTLADSLAELPASQFVVFVDACREDPTPGRGVKGNALSDVMSRGIQIVPSGGAESATFFACSVGERAYEDASYGHGVFTNWILQGLRQGAVAQKPDNSVDMGRLSSYVSTKVGDWAKQASTSGDFELQQTPELVTGGISQPLVLMKLKRSSTEASFAPAAPKLLVAALPEGATVTINGQRAGNGVQQSLPEGDVSVTVSAPGYAPVARSVKALGGYQQEVLVQLQPAAGGVAGGSTTPMAGDPAAALYQRAAEAEGRQQWEVAEQGYSAAIAANPKFLPAYNSLLEMHRLEGRNVDALGDALGLVNNSPRDPAALATLSRAYSRYAEKGAGADNALTTVASVSGYGMPRSTSDAISLAGRAAGDALAINPSFPAASLAQGYALAAQDSNGKNKRAALGAFGKAVFLDSTDGYNELGLGYGIRYYAVQQKKDDDKRAEVTRAVATLQDGVKLRPDSYDLHRELAYCYTLLGQTDAALHEYEQANAHRGAAVDANEVAGNDVAMCGLHKKAAENSTGDKKTAHEQASDGYMAEAKETAPDMKIAMQVLSNVGISTSLSSYVPNELRPLMNIKGTVQDKIRNKIPGLGGIHF